MRTKPTLRYCGLTVVMSNPSRNDIKKLLTGYAGKFFNEDCLRPQANVMQCDIRTMDTIGEGLLPGTKGILLLGENCLRSGWVIKGRYDNYKLGEQRGCPLQSPFNLPCIISYLPQDAIDIVDWEGRLNQKLKDMAHEEERLKEKQEGKQKGITSRSNWRFWLAQDTRKILSKIQAERDSAVVSEGRIAPSVRIFPSSSEIINVLTTTKNEDFFIDIETDSELNISCIGFAFGGGPVYVTPILRYDYTPAYAALPSIFRALAIALRDNTTVIHNSAFDLFVIAHKYGIPPGHRIYDTMLAQHRCYPEAEISLGHCMSMWTWEEYHKDEGVFEPQNTGQERKLWEYNAKDIHGMRLVYWAQRKYAAKIPGLGESIAQSNECIRPYLLNTLFGIRYSQTKLEEMRKANDRLMTQYLRVVRILVGPKTFDSIRTKDASMCSSSAQAVKYFHDILGYKIVKKSKKTQKPSLDGDAMYKLKLQYPENIVIDLILKFRERAKESSTLGWTPWKSLPEKTLNLGGTA